MIVGMECIPEQARPLGIKTCQYVKRLMHLKVRVFMFTNVEVTLLVA